MRLGVLVLQMYHHSSRASGFMASWHMQLKTIEFYVYCVAEGPHIYSLPQQKHAASVPTAQRPLLDCVHDPCCTSCECLLLVSVSRSPVV